MVAKKKIYFDNSFQVTLLEVIYYQNVLRKLLILENTSIVLVNYGSISFEVNQINISISANEIIVIPKRTFVENLLVTNPLQICLLSFSSEFANENSILKPWIGYFEIFINTRPNGIALKQKELIHVLEIFNFLKHQTKSAHKNRFRKECLLFSFNLLLYEIAGFYDKYYQNIQVINSEKQVLIFRFFALLERNCRSQHQVKFYADALFITSGHLNKLVKAITGKTPKQFIEEALILEIKIMLLDSNYSISDIIDELHFPNASYFSNFFKRGTGISPTSYRLRLHF
ncbi:helix-turn-helix domain-containing protein [Flavobacterium xanthum]|uniref:AraC-type DNA-binding protein n=1 Tax=Flavobacterium xanthum TaxID=69322 RepID=A0A1M7LYF1_9FLAO|nr:AraC family transcriptional regulator [Flavobacterium xanthum]SHM83356.1 AraC-type DNA-binding protein [Flavobacterium xanthum]